MTPHFVQLGNECSLSYLSGHMAEKGYVLLQVDWWDAMFVTSHVHSVVFPDAPVYDDLTWWLHGYVANAPSDAQRTTFLNRTAFKESLSMAPEKWLQQLRAASMANRALTFDQLTQMRTDLFYFCTKDHAVQTSPNPQDGAQPFTLE